jgi:hypothetical protein
MKAFKLFLKAAIDGLSMHKTLLFSEDAKNERTAIKK